MRMIKAIFFDMDGVLLDSMYLHTKSWQYAFSQKEIYISQDVFYELGGLPFVDTVHAVGKIENRRFTHEEALEFRAYKDDYFSKHFGEVHAYPILDKLKEMSISIWIVSGASHEVLEKYNVEYFDGLFKQFIGYGDYQFGKPAPDPYLMAFEMSGFEKDEVIVVEDSPLGIESAKTAGLKTIGITTSVSKAKLNDANYVVENHDELFELINKLMQHNQHNKAKW